MAKRGAQAAISPLGLMLLASLLVLGLRGQGAADEAPATIVMSASPSTVSVGMPLTVTIIYRWRRDWSCIHEPDPSQPFQDLFVTAISPPVSSVAGTTESRTYTLTVLPTRSGAWALPQPKLEVSAPGKPPYEATAGAVIVTVGRAAAGLTAPSPRPFAVRPPDPVHHPLWWVAACVVAAIGIWITVMLLLRRTREIQRVQSAHELLQETLARALQTTDGKEAAALTSLALRRFAGILWKFDGPGSTAREAIHLVRAQAREDEYRDFSRLLDELEALRWTPDALASQQLQPTIDASQRWGQRIHERLQQEAAERERSRVKPRRMQAVPP